MDGGCAEKPLLYIDYWPNIPKKTNERMFFFVVSTAGKKI
jgi:hypothetical protein